MSMKRTILTWGPIVGAVSITLMLATLALADRIGFGHSFVLGYSALVLSALLIFPGIRSYRDHVAGGQITFGRAFLVGAGIALVAAICYGAIWAFVYVNFMPDFCDKYGAFMLDKERAAGASAEKLAEVTSQIADMKRLMANPVTNAAMAFLEPFPVGLLASAISAAILRTKRKAA